MHFQISTNLALVGVSTAAIALNGLFALWAATTKRHWFWVATASLAVIALLLRLPSDGLVWFFLGHLAVVVAAIRGRRVLATRRRRDSDAQVRNAWQFSLKDAILLIAIASAAAAEFAIFIRIEECFSWDSLRYGMFGGATGVITLAMCWGSLPGRWRWAKVLAALVFAIVASLPLEASKVFRVGLIPIWGVAPGEWLVLAWLMLASRGRGIDSALVDTPVKPNAPWRRLAVIALTAVIVAPVAWVAAQIRPPASPRAPEGKNGMSDILALSKRFDWKSIPNYDTDSASSSELIGFWQDNLAVIAELHERIKQPAWSRQTTINFNDAQAQREISRGFAAAMRGAFESGDFETGTAIFVDAMRLSAATVRYGMIVPLLVGGATTEVQTACLEPWIQKLTEAQCQELITVVAAIEAERDSLAVIKVRDRALSYRELGWQATLYEAVQRAPGVELEYKTLMQNAYDRDLARLRLLLCELAIQAYQSRHGHAPDRLDELTPEYLAALPADPFGRGAFIYRRTAEGHVLYSLGEDRVDSSGVRAANTRDDQDLFLPRPDPSE